MMIRARARARWLLVLVFATAMAWMESATVYYLRLMFDRLEPYQPDAMPMRGVVGPVELVRELATLVMLFTVGLLAGRTRRSRIGYMAIAFGAWDILYYVFLKVIYGWPKSLFDWDVLFLLPLPWWGPVLAPMLIAALMVVWGTLITQRPNRSATPIGPTLWGVSWVGIALALYVFMADTIRTAGQGVDAVRMVLPTSFNWPLFIVALALMAAPIVECFSGSVDHTSSESLVISR